MSIPDALLRLAPAKLPNYRSLRSDGGVFGLPLAQFEPIDRDLLERVYQAINDFAILWRSMSQSPDFAVLEQAAIQIASGPVMTQARRIGLATRAAGRENAAIRRVVHDVRGGGLVAVLGTLDLLRILPLQSQTLLRKCAEAARDHAKIMRNLVADLDPVERTADEVAKPHNVDHFVNRWSGTTLQGPNGPVPIEVRCSFQGAVSARCLETASIDRILYNYVNNAVRFVDGGPIVLWVFRIGKDLTRIFHTPLPLGRQPLLVMDSVPFWQMIYVICNPKHTAPLPQAFLPG